MTTTHPQAAIELSVEEEILVEVRALKEALHGTAQEPGLFERVRRVEAVVLRIDSYGRWLMVGVGGILLSLAWEIVRWYLQHK